MCYQKKTPLVIVETETASFFLFHAGLVPPVKADLDQVVGVACVLRKLSSYDEMPCHWTHNYFHDSSCLFLFLVLCAWSLTNLTISLSPKTRIMPQDPKRIFSRNAS